MSCATPTSPAPQPWNGQVLVSGRIIDYFTDAGVAGAHVAIGGTTPSTAVTDASGFYSLSVPAGEQSVVAVDGQTIAIVVQMDFPTFRGGYYVNGTGCAARYGMVVDKTTRRPVSGAAIRVSPGPIAASTDGGGWYKLSYQCAPCQPGSTTIAFVTYPNYVDASFSIGRGFCGVSRVDVEMPPR